MNIKNKKSSFVVRTTLTIVCFSIGIVLFAYLFQNLYLNYFYEVYKIDQVNSIAKRISSSEDLHYYLSKASMENDVCIQYLYDGGSTLYNENLKGCLLNSPDDDIMKIMDKMFTNEKDTNFYKIINPNYKTKSFLFGMRISGGYVFINSHLESLDATIKALTGQYGYLLVVIIVLACIIAYFVSYSITKPIAEITKKAKKMGSGDLNVVFAPSKISEINELSETLNYARGEMVKTDDYRRDLMANVGHDLKTPLTLIKSYAEMVRDITYKDDEKRTDHLNVIIKESDRLNELVNDIVELSTLEANAEVLNLEKFDLIATIKETISNFEILKLTENYNFVYSGPEKASVKADEKKIRQVIYNLINNAVNYTGDDMTVYITVSKVKTGYQVEIIDTGKGIDDETIKHVWNRYYKTDKKHKRNKVGTGLGLSIVREILEAHGFTYGVKSTIGKGTNFYFVVKTK